MRAKIDRQQLSTRLSAVSRRVFKGARHPDAIAEMFLSPAARQQVRP